MHFKKIFFFNFPSRAFICVFINVKTKTKLVNHIKTMSSIDKNTTVFKQM